MELSDVQKKKLPDTPGVYFFRGKRNTLLYIGRATSLKDRVKSYFARDILQTRGPSILKMVDESLDIDVIQTDSVLEAIILEANLIRKHQPPYNVKEKDDKSFNYLVITKEAYPRVLVVRGKDLDRKFATGTIRYVFGPFPHGLLFKEAMKIVRKIFPFRDTCVPAAEGTESARPCFNAQIGLCPGVCHGAISKTEYAKTIRNIRLFFEGKKTALLRTLQREMKTYAQKQEFERAGQVKKTIFALQHIHDITLLKRDVRDLGRTSAFRVEGYDVAHARGAGMTGVMVVVEDGEVKTSDYRKFRIRSVTGANDTAALREVLTRRFNHDEWRLPNLIVVDGGTAQVNAARKVVEEYNYRIPVVGVVKDERHRPREIIGPREHRSSREADILLANSEAHRFTIRYHRDVLRRRLL
jgi:excinuclease ABC subunit C